MRILYHHRVASKDGQFVHIEEIILALKKAGHDVIVVAPKMSDNTEFGHDGGWVATLKSKLPKWFYETLELGYSGWLLLKLFWAILKHKPDAIYERYNLYQPAGVIASKLLGVPLLLEVNAPLFEERSRFNGGLGMPKIAKMVEHFTWKNASFVLPVTDVLAKIITAQTGREDNIVVIHNGIRGDALNSIGSAEWKEGDVITVGFVGFMHLTCGVEHLLTLMAESPDLPIRLVCIGDGPRAEALSSMSEKMGLSKKAIFKGLIRRDDIFKEVSGFHIAIQPAVTAYASPLKMFEYMAAKSVIVAPSQDNIKEILPDNHAVFFSPGNPASFKNAVKETVESFSAMQAMRDRVYHHLVSEKFTWEANAERIVNIIQESKK